MTFLKKLGGILLKGVEIWGGFSAAVAQQFPSTAPVVNTVSQDLSQIANLIVMIEALGQLQGQNGADKVKLAAPGVAQIILQSTLMVGQHIDNPALFNQGALNIAGGMADVLNSLKADVQTQNKAA